MEMLDIALGKWVSNIVQIIFVFGVLYLGAAGLLDDMSIFTRQHILIRTPYMAIICLYVSLAIIALRLRSPKVLRRRMTLICGYDRFSRYSSD